jgi:hypothetical protein
MYIVISMSQGDRQNKGGIKHDNSRVGTKYDGFNDVSWIPGRIRDRMANPQFFGTAGKSGK